MIKVYRIATELRYNRMVKAKNMHHTLNQFWYMLKDTFYFSCLMLQFLFI